MPRPKRSSAGSTLVEVIVAMVIIVIVGGACLQVLQFNTRGSLSTLKRIQASQYIDRIQNHLQRSNVGTLENHYSQFPQIITDTNYSADVKITDPDPDGARRASIVIRWTLDRSENKMASDVTLSPR